MPNKQNSLKIAVFVAIQVVLIGFSSRGNASQSCISFYNSPPPELYSFKKNFAEFNLLFSQTIVRELEFENKLLAGARRRNYEYFELDESIGKEKLRLLNLLGVRKISDVPLKIQSPDWLEFATNFRNLSKAKKYRPGLVFYRETEGRRDYLLIDPFSEPLPTESQGYKIMPGSVEFNIPFSVVAAGLRAGKFPLMDAVHDATHFVVALKYPEFVDAVIEVFENTKESDYTLGFKRRMFWLLESMSVPDPGLRSQILQFAADEGISPNPNSRTEIYDRFKKMSDDDFLAYSVRLSKMYNATLADISGGTANSSEKINFASQALLGTSIEANAYIDGRAGMAQHMLRILPEIYFGNKPNILLQAPNPTLSDTTVFSFSTVAGALRITSELSRLPDEDLAERVRDTKSTFAESTTNEKGYVTGYRMVSGGREKILDINRKIAALAEYSMLAGVKFSFSDWAHGMLQSDLPLDHPLAKFLRECFPNDQVSDLYLGIGKKRQKK